MCFELLNAGPLGSSNLFCLELPVPWELINENVIYGLRTCMGEHLDSVGNVDVCNAFKFLCNVGLGAMALWAIYHDNQEFSKVIPWACNLALE